MNRWILPAVGLGLLMTGPRIHAQVCPEAAGRSAGELAATLDAAADVVMAGAVLKVANSITEDGEQRFAFIETRRVWRGFVPHYLRVPLGPCDGGYLQGVSYLFYLDAVPDTEALYVFPAGLPRRPLVIQDNEDLVEELGEPLVRWNGGRRFGPDLVAQPAEATMLVPAAAVVPAGAEPPPVSRVVTTGDCAPASPGSRKACVEVLPAYPPEARARCLSGRVVAHVNVDPAGEVLFVKIVEEDPVDAGFGTRAVEALLQTRFQPLLESTQPRTVQTRRETVLFDPGPCAGDTP